MNSEIFLSQTDTDTLVEPKQDTESLPTDDGDHDRFSHYVKKAGIMESAVEGTSLEALCGKKWVPSRDPKKYPICPSCKEIFETLKQ